MSGILAVLNRDGRPQVRSGIRAILDSCLERAVDGQATWISGAVALGHQHFLVTPEERGESQPLRDAETGSVITADLRLDNRAVLLRALGLEPAARRGLGDAALVLHAYRRWGEACVEHLLGDFVFAIWDAAAQGLFVARDALGSRSVCYHLDASRLLVASEIEQILAHPAVEPRLNERKVADHLAFLFDDQEQTFYEGVYYLPPAHCLWVTARASRRWRYWELGPQPLLGYRRDREYAEHFLALLRESVRCRMRSVAPVGISLSGGLDSSLLAAVASELLPETVPQPRLKTFSYVFDELSSCDERQYIRPVVDRYGIEARYIPCDGAWTLRRFYAWPVCRDFVLWDPHAWLPHALTQEAQQAGCRLLLAGYFGDVLCTPGAYWAADLIGRMELGALARLLIRHRADIDWRRDMIRQGLAQWLPQPVKTLYRRLRPGRPTVRLHPGFAQRTHLRERIALEQARRSSSKSVRARWYAHFTANCFTQPPASVRKAYNARGLELEIPYQDRRLLEFVMAVPAEQLGRPGRDRWVHRNAMSGLVPERVRERRGRTSFLPLMERGLLDKERERVRRILENPQIVSREMVDATWLRREVEAGAAWTGHGAPLWLCLSLEIWLQRFWK